MSTLEHFRHGLDHFRDGIVEGWQLLRERASQAITRFRPIRDSQRDVETTPEQMRLRGSRWGLLTADVHENDSEVVIRLEAPGMEASDFVISIESNHLLIRGDKYARRQHKEGQYHITECAYGHFERSLPLPAGVDDSQARASYQDGVLMLSLPKLSGDKRHRIEVQTG